jgi:phage shock protein C
MEKKRLYKSKTDKKLAGVCGGVARYFGIDSTIVRLIWVCLVLFAGCGLLAYLIAALVMPNEDSIINDVDVVDAVVTDEFSSEGK